ADSLFEAKSASGKAICTGFVLQLKIALTNKNQAAVFLVRKAPSCLLNCISAEHNIVDQPRLRAGRISARPLPAPSKGPWIKGGCRWPNALRSVSGPLP